MEEFWSMTVAELRIVLKAFTRRERRTDERLANAVAIIANPWYKQKITAKKLLGRQGTSLLGRKNVDVKAHCRRRAEESHRKAPA